MSPTWWTRSAEQLWREAPLDRVQVAGTVSRGWWVGGSNSARGVARDGPPAKAVAKPVEAIAASSHAARQAPRGAGPYPEACRDCLG